MSNRVTLLIIQYYWFISEQEKTQETAAKEQMHLNDKMPAQTVSTKETKSATWVIYNNQHTISERIFTRIICACYFDEK